MSLAENIVSDANKVFLNPSEFAESVTVLEPGESPRPIAAIVIRRPAGEIAPGWRIGQTTFKFRVRVCNDPVLGIDPPAMDRGTWQLGIATKVGGTVENRQIVATLDQDAGMTLLACD
jgi:hypothetical protein